MRINKYLALQSICSRREADELIKLGKVFINKRRAELGDQVEEGDQVEVKGSQNKELVYFAFNKPKGIITHSPQGEEREIADILKTQEKIYPVGRLDKDSYGLIIMTNDGRITGRLLEPDQKHEKEYEVVVDKTIDDSFIQKIQNGPRLDDGYRTQKCEVKQLGNKSFKIILTEGKKRQIRRMCEVLGKQVVDLKRVRIENIKLNKLRLGEARPIKGPELAQFLDSLGL